MYFTSFTFESQNLETFWAIHTTWKVWLKIFDQFKHWVVNRRWQKTKNKNKGKKTTTWYQTLEP